MVRKNGGNISGINVLGMIHYGYSSLIFVTKEVNFDWMTR